MRTDRTGRSKGTARHVRLYHWLMETDAWRDLRPNDRGAYIELARRYAGPDSNNGRIGCSVREIAFALHVSKATAERTLENLQAHGFIVLEKKARSASSAGMPASGV